MKGSTPSARTDRHSKNSSTKKGAHDTAVEKAKNLIPSAKAKGKEGTLKGAGVRPAGSGPKSKNQSECYHYSSVELTGIEPFIFAQTYIYSDNTETKPTLYGR